MSEHLARSLLPSQFLADLEATAEAPALPAFVVAEVEAFLKCEIEPGRTDDTSCASAP